jgi:hypothetical protein
MSRVRFEDDELDDEDGYEDEDFEESPDLGPDERDADLLDGTWEQRYYTQRASGPDWHGIQVGIALLLAIALLVPLILAALG